MEIEYHGFGGGGEGWANRTGSEGVLMKGGRSEDKRQTDRQTPLTLSDFITIDHRYNSQSLSIKS